MKKLAFAAIALTFSSAAVADHAGAPTKGERVFRKCRSCHEVGEDAKYKVGPALNNLMGQQAGVLSGDKASKALKRAGELGMKWDLKTLEIFLRKPKALIPKTKMKFSGLKKHEDRANLIAYFQNLGAGEKPVKKDPTLSDAVLALVGDVEYGEYLASGCTTCHQADGSDQGLPSITGWPAPIFATAMHAYKTKDRENSVMQQQAGALDNEEIAALAAYFAGVTK